jgi:transcriptional regulator with XRE-family HTH domain
MIPVQCKMARVALDWGVRDLAQAAEVSPDTIARLERGDPLKASTVNLIQSTLQAAGVDFIPQNGGGSGVRLIKYFPVLRDHGGPGIMFEIPYVSPDVTDGIGEPNETRLAFYASPEVLKILRPDINTREGEIRCFLIHRRRLANGAMRAFDHAAGEITSRRRKSGAMVLKVMDFALR